MGCSGECIASFSLGHSNIGLLQINQSDAYSAQAMTCRHREDRRELKLPVIKEAKLGLEENAGREQSRAASKLGMRRRAREMGRKGPRRPLRVISLVGGCLRRRWGRWGFEDGQPCVRWRERSVMVMKKRFDLNHRPSFFGDHIMIGFGFVWTLPLVMMATKLRCLLSFSYRLEMRAQCDKVLG